MATTKTTKAPKAAATVSHAASNATIAALVGPVQPVAAVPATTPAPSAPVAAPATPTAVVYNITAKAQLIAPHLTLQRGCTVAVGAHWRANGHKATNTRALAMQALAALGSTFSHDAAVAALLPLKQQALLGSGTPASYLRAFVKSGYLAQA